MKKLTIIIIGIAVVITVFAVRTLIIAGEFKTIDSHFAGSCIPVEGAIGAEDITILSNGTALISADDRRKTLAGTPVQGAVFSYSLSEQNPKLINLSSDLDFEFHPHGISVFEHENGSVSLAVVNHTEQGHFIELFDLKDDVLVHRRSIADPLMISPNDVVLLDADRFYVTNDHGTVSEFGRTLEEYLQLERCTMLYYDGKSFSVAAQKLGYANGINISRDGETLYVAETVGRRLSLFSRDSNTNELNFSRTIDFNSGVDNIELDADGNLLIGSHQKMLAFTRHAKDAENVFPSQVFRLSLYTGKEDFIDEIYLNDGSELSGSSVAAIYGQTLLIGSVLEPHFLRCDF